MSLARAGLAGNQEVLCLVLGIKGHATPFDVQGQVNALACCPHLLRGALAVEHLGTAHNSLAIVGTVDARPGLQRGRRPRHRRYPADEGQRRACGNLLDPLAYRNEGRKAQTAENQRPEGLNGKAVMLELANHQAEPVQAEGHVEVIEPEVARTIGEELVHRARDLVRRQGRVNDAGHDDADDLPYVVIHHTPLCGVGLKSTIVEAPLRLWKFGH